MSELNYEKATKHISDEMFVSEIYHVNSMYEYEGLRDAFVHLKANVVDLNPAVVTKCIQGTEQDFIMLMNRAKEHLRVSKLCNDAGNAILLDLFQECVFGYYILTPLIKASNISDIKVLAWNKITCKSKGKRYLTDLSFASEEDYRNWFDRILKMHRLQRGEQFALQKCTDRKGVDDYYLRLDFQLDIITSTEMDNIHIRKIPKQKYTWEYLIENEMLTEEMVEYLKDRIAAGYGFLLSGRGGSGKTTLLNNMIDLVPYNESGLVTQESDELYSSHPQFQFEHTLILRKEGVVTEFDLEDELRLGLLQDIDNFIVGEIKGGEALYVFTTANNTGARFMGTIHSNDARSSTKRLAQCARYISDYPVPVLEEMLTSSPFCLIHMSHFSIDEIIEIVGWDSKNHCLIFKEVYEKDRG